MYLNFILAWAFILLLQAHTMLCRSGRRAEQYRHIKEETLSETSIINESKNPKDIDKLQYKHDNIETISGVAHKSNFTNEKLKQNSSRINLTKIKTLLPYVILKRAYSKLKHDKYNKINNSIAKKNLMAYKSRHKPSHEILINSLCKQSATSICKLVSIRMRQHTSVYFLKIYCHLTTYHFCIQLVAFICFITVMVSFLPAIKLPTHLIFMTCTILFYFYLHYFRLRIISLVLYYLLYYILCYIRLLSCHTKYKRNGIILNTAEKNL